MHLKDLKPNQCGLITALNGGEEGYRQRLMALGLLPGTSLILKRFAPMGDPIQVEVRGCLITLRAKEAQILELQMEGTCSTGFGPQNENAK